MSCLPVTKWLLWLRATLPHTTVSQAGRKGEAARGAFFSCASLSLTGKICPWQNSPLTFHWLELGLMPTSDEQKTEFPETYLINPQGQGGSPPRKNNNNNEI